jgi:hypothetical protein
MELIDTIQTVIWRGNAWNAVYQPLDAEGTPLFYNLGNVARMDVLEKRGSLKPPIKRFSEANNSIILGPDGSITISGFTGTETKGIIQDSLIGELCIGPSEDRLIPLLTIIFTIKTGVTIPASV